jgi:hypothetical protein
MENKIVKVRIWEKRAIGNSCLVRVECPFYKMASVLEMGGGDQCTLA